MSKCLIILIILCSFIFVSCDKYTYGNLNVKGNDVALLSIFSDDGKKDSSLFIKNYGHAFLSVTNISDNSFNIGGRMVDVGETITVGLWNILEHFGVWFNVDGNYISQYSKYSNRVSLTIGISNDDLNTLNDVIDDSDKWNVFFNCSAFAITCWNSVAGEGEKLNTRCIVSPSYLTKEISKFDEYEFNREVQTDNKIMYYKEG